MISNIKLQQLFIFSDKKHRDFAGIGSDVDIIICFSVILSNADGCIRILQLHVHVCRVLLGWSCVLSQRLT